MIRYEKLLLEDMAIRLLWVCVCLYAVWVSYILLEFIHVCLIDAELWFMRSLVNTHLNELLCHPSNNRYTQILLKFLHSTFEHYYRITWCILKHHWIIICIHLSDNSELNRLLCQPVNRFTQTAQKPARSLIVFKPLYSSYSCIFCCEFFEWYDLKYCEVYSPGHFLSIPSNII